MTHPSLVRPMAYWRRRTGRCPGGGVTPVSLPLGTVADAHPIPIGHGPQVTPPRALSPSSFNEIILIPSIPLLSKIINTPCLPPQPIARFHSLMSLRPCTQGNLRRQQRNKINPRQGRRTAQPVARGPASPYDSSSMFSGGLSSFPMGHGYMGVMACALTSA